MYERSQNENSHYSGCIFSLSNDNVTLFAFHSYLEQILHMDQLSSIFNKHYITLIYYLSNWKSFLEIIQMANDLFNHSFDYASSFLFFFHFYCKPFGRE